MIALADIHAARERIAPHVKLTPVMTSVELDDAAGAKLFFKCENFQKSGAFKARGAHNAVFALSKSEAKAGVITFSSGNLGAAVALAARRRGIPAQIVVPENAPAAKVEAARRYGGKIIFSPPNFAAREAIAAELQRSTGAFLIHPLENPLVLAGQGTAALEFIEAVPDLQIMIAPIGGGGLVSGTAIAAKGVNPTIRIYGAEPLGADDAARSLQAGHHIPQTNPQTIADGLRASLGQIAFPIIRELVDDILVVSEESIIEAMRLAWEMLKIIIEPSSAVVLAAVLSHRKRVEGKRIGLILSGGNVDLDRLPWMPPTP